MSKVTELGNSLVKDIESKIRTNIEMLEQWKMVRDSELSKYVEAIDIYKQEKQRCLDLENEIQSKQPKVIQAIKESSLLFEKCSSDLDDQTNRRLKDRKQKELRKVYDLMNTRAHITKREVVWLTILNEESKKIQLIMPTNADEYWKAIASINK